MSTTTATVSAAGQSLSRKRGTVALGFLAPFLAEQLIGVWAAPLLPLAFGVMCLRSLLIGRPLMAVMAERTGRTPDLSSPRIQRSLRTVTAVWGAVMTGQAVALAVFAATLSTSSFAIANPVISYGVTALMGAATFLYVRRTRSRED
ncbi:MAG: hypothetical protein ACRDNK_15880 [Solirubrobacteraceae bacterium]